VSRTWGDARADLENFSLLVIIDAFILNTHNLFARKNLQKIPRKNRTLGAPSDMLVPELLTSYSIRLSDREMIKKEGWLTSHDLFELYNTQGHK
jgi:ABC-type uncharacterized transport system involved in gliding motility auxiliary subunit